MLLVPVEAGTKLRNVLVSSMMIRVGR